ncbi:hypothetical protein [Rhodococcus opacus]|nr:hypothetical protein [Rhodococcus opacus]
MHSARVRSPRRSPRREHSRAGVLKVGAALLALALLVGAGILSRVLDDDPAGAVAAQIVYTAPTANDSTVALPAVVEADLQRIGLGGGQVAVTRIDSTASVETSVLDLSPRDAPDAPILKVHERAVEAIDAKLTTLEEDINSAPATSGNRALYVGLLKTNVIEEGPIYILSSGLDLTSPVDTRALAFDVPSSQVVDRVRAARELPALNGARITFVMIPSTGAQEQLRDPQRGYLEDLWTALLTAGGASSVTFVDATSSAAASTVAAPAVPLPPLPGTPIKPASHPEHPAETVCELATATYFVGDTAELVNEETTKLDLKECVAEVGATTAVSLDAWTAYYGPVDAGGAPATNLTENIALSDARNQAIADLLVELGIDRGRITRMTGHGNADQPYPNDPSSEKNRVCTVTFVNRTN